jgi:hypothetical protein
MSGPAGVLGPRQRVSNDSGSQTPRTTAGRPPKRTAAAAAAAVVPAKQVAQRLKPDVVSRIDSWLAVQLSDNGGELGRTCGLKGHEAATSKLAGALFGRPSLRPGARRAASRLPLPLPAHRRARRPAAA